MKQRLEPVVVHDAAGAADLRRDAVGALFDPAGRFGIDRRTFANPLHDGGQVCQELRVDAGGFGFGSAHTVIVRGMRTLSRTAMLHTPTAAAALSSHQVGASEVSRSTLALDFRPVQV